MLFVTSLSLLTSCAVTPPDQPLCTQVSQTKGYCINTISSTEFEISEEKLYKGKTWWQIKPYMIYMPIDSWVEMKKFIIKVCKRYKCKGKSISDWSRTVEAIDKKIIAK